MDERPRGRIDDEAPATGDGLAPDVLAEWITEDVVQRLYASRQDIADAVLAAPGSGVGPPAEVVRERLLVVIGNLRELAARLRTSPDVRSSPRGLTPFEAAVARECENARALIAQCADALCQDRRIRAEDERLARDGARLRRACAAARAAATA